MAAGLTQTLQPDYTLSSLVTPKEAEIFSRLSVEFASLQDQINLEFEGYENYGDKFTKASS